jgi:hypothetical protein
MQPGTELEGDTSLGKVKRNVPAPKYLARPGEITLGPPGARGPSGEDLSGLPTRIAQDETTGAVRYLGAVPLDEKSAVQYALSTDPRVTPAMKAQAMHIVEEQAHQFVSPKAVIQQGDDGHLYAVSPDSGTARAIPTPNGVTFSKVGQPPKPANAQRDAFESKLMANPNMRLIEVDRRMQEWDRSHGSAGAPPGGSTAPTMPPGLSPAAQEALKRRGFQPSR